MPDQLSRLPITLDRFRQGQLPVRELAQQWRDAADAHEPALPARYREVLERVLSQLESSAWFSEESCSFSQGDLIQTLSEWLDKARALPA